MGRGLDRFDATQRTFLENYLKGGFFNRKSDTAKADAFKDYLDAETATQTLLGQLAGRSDQIDAITAALTTAGTHKDAGKFAEATAEAERALALARAEETAVHHRGREKLRLSGVMAGLEAPVGATDAETSAVNNRKTVVMQLLAGDPPSAEDLAAAEQGILDLSAAIAAVNRAIGARANRKAQLSKDHTETLARLNAINATLARATSDAEHSTLTGTATTLRGEIDALGAAASGTNDGQVQTQLGNVAGIKTALDQFERSVEAALLRALKAGMDETGLSDAQKDTLAALGKTDPAAMAAAVTALEEMETTLNGATITQADLVTRAAATAAQQAACENQAEKVEAARKTVEDAKGVAETALTVRDALTAQVGEATTDIYAHREAFAAALADADHPDYAEAYAKDVELYATYTDLAAKRDAAGEDFDSKVEAYEAAKADLQSEKAELTNAQAALDAARTSEKAALGKKKLLDAVTFGPLNPNSATALSDPVSTQIIALYGKEPQLADRAARTAAKSRNPESVALAATAVCDKVGSKFSADGLVFAGADYAQTYGERLIDMSSHLPPAEAAKLDAYLTSGRHFKDVPGVTANKNQQKTGKTRSEFVGKELLKTDGTMDFDKGRDAMLDVMFHPKSLSYPTSAQTMHMLDTLDFLEGSTEAQDLLSTTPDPTESGALGLLAKITGKQEDAIDKGDAQTAILTAMLTPMYQGKVGSCFATGGLIKQQQERPLEMMEGLKQMAVEGTFQPKSGDAVNAVQSVSDDENGLLRSYEYTTATATARLTDSIERNQLETSIGKAVDYLSDDFKKKKREALKATLKTSISDAFDFVYDPTVEGTGSDNSSTHGSFQLVRKSDKKVITNQTEFADTLEAVIMATLSKKDTKFRVSPEDVAAWARVDQFLDAVRVNGKLPWELNSGGFENQAAQVLEGGTSTVDGLSKPADAATMDVAERTKDVVGDMIGRLGNSPDKLVCLSTEGKFNHAFNFMPDHPSLVPFKSDDPDEVKAKVQALMIEKAANAASTAMPLDKVTFLFDREMEAIAKRSKGEAKAEIEAVWANNRPTTEMTPRQFEDHVKAATADWEEKTAEIAADAWRARRVKKGETVTDEAYDEKKAEVKTATAKERAHDMSNRLRDDLDLPEIVIADTNWGNPAAHHYFALAPDPLTGLPQMYLKSDPPGTLSELKDAPDWLASYWCTTV